MMTLYFNCLFEYKIIISENRQIALLTALYLQYLHLLLGEDGYGMIANSHVLHHVSLIILSTLLDCSILTVDD